MGIDRSAKEVRPLYRVVGISTFGSLNPKVTPSGRSTLSAQLPMEAKMSIIVVTFGQ
jgi:hypothetical protein